MRRHLGIIATIVIALGVIIALSAAGNIEFDRPSENEFAPNRSSYNSGPTGARAFYQLLEETGTPVARWRDDFSRLKTEARDAALIIVGPFPLGRTLPAEEAGALRQWVAAGGRLLIVSRAPREQFGDPVIHSRDPQKPPDWNAPPEQIVDEQSDKLIAQPTELTRNVRGLALSKFASRIKFHPPDPRADPRADPSETKPEDDTPWSEPPPSPKPEPPPEAENEARPRAAEDYSPALLYAPVIHLGDKDGAALADFNYGQGRVIFLSDPFVIANNGIARGANLTLALNLTRALGAPGRKIFLDEFHHGYRGESNPLVNYFRGTPAPWLLLQGLLLSLLIVYTHGWRFARPLPLPRIDRHSPLEFVGSMANLQQAARARGLALENIYPRFKAHLCRRLGLSSRARKDEIVERARGRRWPIPEAELRQTLSEAEAALAGGKLDDQRLVALVAGMRRIISRTRR